MAQFFAGQGAPTNGTSGTRATDVYFGDEYQDVTNGILYYNTSRTAGSPTWHVKSGLSNAGALTVPVSLVVTPDAGTTVVAGTTIPADAPYVLINSGSALTITAHPAIATTGVATGTRIYVENTNASNAITLTDDGTDIGSKIKLRTGTTLALAAGLAYGFLFDGTNWTVL